MEQQQPHDEPAPEIPPQARRESRPSRSNRRQQQQQGFIGRMFGAPAPPPSDTDSVETELPEEIEARRLRAVRQQLEDRAQIDRLNAETAERNRLLEDQAYYALREHMIGKKLDATWKAYACNSVRDYLDRNNVVDSRIRVDIIDRAINRYLDFLRDEKHLTVSDVLAIRAHNNDVRGEVKMSVWWNPWTWHRDVSVSENSNGSSPETTLYSGTQVFMMGLAGVGLMIGGRYIISRVFSGQINSTITPKVESLPTLPMKIDMQLPSSLSTKLERLVDVIAISGNSSDIPNPCPGNSTSIELLTELSGRCINKLSDVCKKVVVTVVEYSRSQK